MLGFSGSYSFFFLFIYFSGQENLGPWGNGMSEAAAEAPGPSDDSTLVLAAKRTNRPNILHGFKRYRGGWDITSRHYWAVSLAFCSFCYNSLIVNVGSRNRKEFSSNTMQLNENIHQLSALQMLHINGTSSWLEIA